MLSLPLRCLIALSLLFASAAQAAQSVEEVKYPGGTERVLLLAPAHPKATVVLLVGGDGIVDLDPLGNLGQGGNFLARTRGRWAARDIALLLPDAPGGASLLGRRENAGYAAALAAVVDLARARLPGPVFLVGHSQGTNGAVSTASRLPPHAIAGIVLASTITVAKKPPLSETVFDADLSSITVPALILADSDDQCPLSPPAGAERVHAALGRSPAVEVEMVTGGKPAISEPCQTNAGHGFYGQQNAVIDRMADWIEATLRSQ